MQPAGLFHIGPDPKTGPIGRREPAETNMNERLETLKKARIA